MKKIIPFFPVLGLTDRFARRTVLRYTANYLSMPRVPLHHQMVELLFSFLTVEDVQQHYIMKFNIDAERADNHDTLVNEMITLWSKPATSAEIRKTTGVLLAAKLKQRGGEPNTPLRKKIHELQELHQLSDMERDCVLFLYLSENDSLLEGALDCSRHFCQTGATGRVTRLVRIAGLRRTAVLKAVAESAPLRRYGLVDDYLDIENQVTEYLSGFNNQPLASQFFTEYKGEALCLDDHTSVTPHLDILKGLLEKHTGADPLHVLFYGVPGTGKTELARSLAVATGRKLYEINHIPASENRYTDEKFRFTAAQACANAVDAMRSLILIDEADEMLNGAEGLFNWGAGTGNANKGIINSFMDGTDTACIWITNRFQQINESTRRRFDYSIAFPAFSLEQRVAVWKRCVMNHDLDAVLTDEQILQLARKYRTSAGGIGLVLRNLKRLTTKQTDPIAVIETVLSQHLQLMNPGNDRKQTAITDKYVLDGLNIRSEVPLAECLQTLQSFCAYTKEHAQTDKIAIRNYNLLLSGPPGTGKTEFVKYLAQELGCELMVKRASDLLSKWIGETEQQLAEAFQAAEAANAILFFDEIDGLLSSRAGASQSWQVTQVNELLVSMENFRGIFVAATNFRKRMDPASVRRFNLKIDFDYLDEAGKRTFFARFLEPMTGRALNKQEASRLSRIPNLTPGDYKVVWQRHAFVQPADLSNDRLLSALAEEVQHKNGDDQQPIGF